MPRPVSPSPSASTLRGAFLRQAAQLFWQLPLLALMAMLAMPASANAHQLGQTRVTVTFAPDRTFIVDITVDPESLLAKLEILANQAPSAAPVARDELPTLIAALQRVLLANTQVTFDGKRADLAFAYLPAAPPAPAAAPTGQTADRATAMPSERAAGAANSAATAAAAATGPGGAPTAVVRLTGTVPSEAKAFRFTYGLVMGSYPLTISGGAQSTRSQTVWLAGGQESEVFDLTNGFVPDPPSRLHVAMQYLGLGFEHIVPKGIDHILFVLGIFLLSTAWRPILQQVTTFTIAHSITLGLTIYGIVSLPPSIVEPLIALSITYVAIENLFTSTLRPWRIVLVFAFGLLHGMGFAGVLKDLGLPRSEFLTALVTFNLGVEAGQLTVIACALLAVGWWRWRSTEHTGRYRRWIVIPASLLIAAVGAYWTIARVISPQ
jgi:hypothetical protein